MANHFFSAEDQQRIISAIKEAELATSGEIRVHIEPKTDKAPMERAKEVFEQLGMTNTELKNAVLIYVASKSRKLAILGDSGIHEQVGNDFWQAEKNLLTSHFAKGNYAIGLAEAIHLVGQKLKTHFPYQSTDTNELSNEISFGGAPDESF